MIERLPWIGKNYNTSKSSLMVVGRLPHLSKINGTEKDKTKNIVTDVIKQEITGVYYSYLVKMLSGKKTPSPKDTEKVWNNICFYSYFNTNTIHISNATFNDHFPQFITVLKKYKPSNVLIFTRTLWEYMYEILYKEYSLEMAKGVNQFHLNGNNIRITGCALPRSNYSNWDENQNILDAILGKSKRL